MIAEIQLLSNGTLVADDKVFRCAIGQNGLSNGTFEGSRTTPIGTFALRAGFYRADKIKMPASGIALSAIQKDDGWCDEPEHPLYNTHVKLPFAASHEKLWHDEDDCYDVIIPIGYNDAPVVPRKGSAIFLHIARPDYAPTLGCVAISQADMFALLPLLSLATRIVIGG